MASRPHLGLSAAGVVAGIAAVNLLSEIETGEPIRIPAISTGAAYGIMDSYKAICEANNLKIEQDGDELVISKKDNNE